MRTSPLARRYAQWLDRRRWLILAGSLALAIVGGLYAIKLPIYGDFSYLLPPEAPSVRQLHALEKRVNNFGTLMVAVVSDDPAQRGRVAEQLRDRFALIDHGLISDISFDDHAAREFIWDHRFLYASKEDLAAARDALHEEIAKANPLYVSFDDDDATTTTTQPADKAQQPNQKKDRAQALRAKLDDAEQKKDARGRISADGKMQLIVLRTTFDSGSASKAQSLTNDVDQIVNDVRAANPGVTIGLSGDVPTGLAEHSALLAGMLRSSALTIIIVAFGLLLYYRSWRGVGALMWSLTVGTAVTFGVTRLTIGYLNLASAFLSSIVVGNGINFGMILLARHLEERRTGRNGVEAIAAALSGTFTGTLAAALTGAVAYGSLAATNFKGFRHFGAIGGIGMVLCWISAYTILPAALAVLERRGLRAGSAPSLGKLLARLAPTTHRGVGVVAGVALLVVCGAGVATYKYLLNPYEGNFRNLRSSNPALDDIRDWQGRIDKTFGNHISGGFAMATTTPEEASRLSAHLHAVDAGKDDKDSLFGSVSSLDDVLPADQDDKLVILAELRRMIDKEAKHLDDDERDTALRLRPPDDLRKIGGADLPAELAMPFREKDGTLGRLVYADASSGYDTWLSHDLLEFTARVEELELGRGTIYGGSNFVFADVIRSMEGDGPKATLIALAGSLLIIALLVGLRRHGAVTLICMMSGTLLMVAGAWLAGLRVNFLDFVALPITLGIGIDYSVNIVTRERQEESGSARAALATTGGAVLMCSFTTIIGYGSLLLSPNQGIRSFGAAAILGEMTCISAALVLAPALLQLLAPRGAAVETAAQSARRAS